MTELWGIIKMVWKIRKRGAFYVLIRKNRKGEVSLEEWASYQSFDREV